MLLGDEKADPKITLRDLYPDASEEELKEAEEFWGRWIYTHDV
jgi:hypothetical protein